MSDLRELLDLYRAGATSEHGKGTQFERLIQAFLGHDPVYQEQFDAVWPYAEWAGAHDLPGKDIGIDLVARHRGDGSYCAIQCKLYGEDRVLAKKDVDSFFAASGKSHFKSRLFFDTTVKPWGGNAEELLKDQHIPFQRINIEALEQSRIDWNQFRYQGKPVLKPAKTPFPHQQEAIDAVVAGLETVDRGKLLMACGTGKTYTSLQIAEKVAGPGKRVLYLVSSLALMSQTIREWHNDSNISLQSFAVCSDGQVGKRTTSDDIAALSLSDLALPATTDAATLAKAASVITDDKMQVIFATYHSLRVISAAQLQEDLADFDLIICDEAHRTTGVTLSGEDESAFVLVHDQTVLHGSKRLYMTATERLYHDTVKSKAKAAAAELCSMDDAEIYGEVLHRIGFAEAVERGLLCDYKVLVLAMDEALVSQGVQQRLSESNLLKLDDATRIVGCYRALAKQGLQDQLGLDHHPMQRALAFCKSIETSRDIVKAEFGQVIAEFLENTGQDPETAFQCAVDHIDGSFNAKQRQQILQWLADNNDSNTCRIVSNARCLSEGVDIPSLDAVLFLNPRKSIIDIVQAVGRVMRRSDETGKKQGYIILPVGIPAGIDPAQALENSKDYKVIWQVLNALRAHDERMDATINSGEDGNGRIGIYAEILDVRLSADDPRHDNHLGEGSVGIGSDREMALERDDGASSLMVDLPPVQGRFIFDEFREAVMAKIVKNCGTRSYWQDWSRDIADIAKTHITLINAAIGRPGSAEAAAFETFLAEVHDDLNDSISKDEAIEMLAQHVITKPVFDALFSNSGFTRHNPVSVALQKVLEKLEGRYLEKEATKLDGFYASVRRRVDGIVTSHGRQKIVLELYDSFFSQAFPRLAKKLGIVYTPVEVVDFIIHSVNDILQQEFGQTLGSKGVHILDPFTGTGTFITRLLQSGLIKPEELTYKYRHEIHANEIMLLAYYIAAINIEQAYHDISGSNDYEAFKGICLTDTFQLYEKDDMISNLLAENSDRRVRQKNLDIRVIMGNPPYSAGQRNANDDNANVKYPMLDEAIRTTYAANSSANNLNGLYDSYIRAIRWASDRLADAENGVVGFISGNAWIERNFADGLRQQLRKDFASIYVVNLRGDIRKNMLSRGLAKEGGNIFGSGSMTGICIAFFIKSEKRTQWGKIYYHDIGDDKGTTEKLQSLKDFAANHAVTHERIFWQEVQPNEHHDWINLRDTSFERFLKVGDKKEKPGTCLFDSYSVGVKTQRDAWCYNSSASTLLSNMERTISFLNQEVDRLAGEPPEKISDMLVRDSTRFSWTAATEARAKKGQAISFQPSCIRQSLYRPFSKAWLYFERSMNERVYQIPRLFPNASLHNLVIVVSGIGARSGFSVLMTDLVPNLHTLDTGQCFPLFDFETPKQASLDRQANLLDQAGSASNTIGLHVRNAISDSAFEYISSFYGGANITKEDIFYYVYGLLHSEEYRQRFKNNLSKELPRIPRVKTIKDFWAFVDAGRKLGDLHVNFEQVDPYPVNYADGGLLHDSYSDADYRVTKMKFGGTAKNKDKSTVIYNPKITMTDIPLAAYDYIVNGKSALEWVMDRQVVKTDPASQITNDANDYALETIGDAAYPLKLFQRVITVSLETMKIVRALPALDLEDVADQA